MKLFILLVCFFSFPLSYAKETKIDLSKKYVQSYYETKESLKAFDFLNQKKHSAKKLNKDRCDPTYKSCLEASCDFLPSYECNDEDEIRNIARACRGNYNGDCLKKACGFVDSYECDDLDEVSEMAKACAGNYNGACVQTACGLVDSYECDDLDEASEVARACRGNHDGQCVAYVCARLGSHDCDDRDEVVQVAKDCADYSRP